MVETGTLILAIIASGLIGIVAGAALHKQFGHSGSQTRRLSAELEEAQEKGEKYRQEVADHFSETAGLLNNLTQQYRDIHQHLASGADELCRNDDGQSLLTGVPIELDMPARNAATEDLPNPHAQQPPLDYAPKDDASSTGVLSEEFGLDKIAPEAEPKIQKPPLM